LKKIAYDWMGNKRSNEVCERGNKFYHGERVASLVLKLRAKILPNDTSRDEILTVAAWYHDITHGSADHAREGAVRTRELIAPYCCDTETDEICNIIAVHDDRNPECDAYSVYVRLHQDADNLDHFGTFDVWMTFLFSVFRDETINDARDWLLNRRPLENERWRSELNYKISREIFDEKMRFLKHFAERFDVECAGGIWDEDSFCEDTPTTPKHGISPEFEEAR